MLWLPVSSQPQQQQQRLDAVEINKTETFKHWAKFDNDSTRRTIKQTCPTCKKGQSHEMLIYRK